MGCYLSVRSNRILFAGSIMGSASFVLKMRSFSPYFRVWLKDPASLSHHGIQTVVCAASMKCPPLAVHFVSTADEVTGLVSETLNTWVRVIS